MDDLKQQFDNLHTALSNAKLALNTIARAYGHMSFIGGVLMGYFQELEQIHHMAATLEADYCRLPEKVAEPEPGAGKSFDFKIIPDESLSDGTFAIVSAGKRYVYRLNDDGEIILVGAENLPEVRIFTRA